MLGPLTRTVRDAALMLDVLAGPDERDPHSLPAPAGSYLAACEKAITGWSMAWTPDLGYARVDPEVARISEEAAAVRGVPWRSASETRRGGRPAGPGPRVTTVP